MPPPVKPVHLTLQLNAGEDASAEELDHLTRQLLAEIQELEVESVEIAKDGELPEGAKAGEVVTLGSLAVLVLPTVVPKLVEFLQSWSMRGENRTLKIKAQTGERAIELEYSPAAISGDELERLVNTLTKALTPEEKSERP
jgi:hypothetical protein